MEKQKISVLGTEYLIEPRELKVPDNISRRTLEDMDKAISNFKMENVSEVIDLSDF